jgi:acetylornithine deacetylase/succinyl-diaminopimelate desuccinylase-like protein
LRAAGIPDTLRRMTKLDQAARALRPWALEVLKAYCRIPSVSAEGRGIEAAAAFVERSFRGLGLRVRRARAGGCPAILAESPAVPGGRSILFYNHYDVQPPDPLDAWSSPPFEPAVRGGRLYARGVADNKANWVARLAAVRAFRDAGVPLPVQVKFFVDGEEEIGSPTLDRLARRLGGWLRSDLCIWESGSRDERGRPQIELGCKGIVQGELVCRGARSDQHSSRAVIVPSPAWRLVWALASIKGPDERIRIDGFRDGLRRPTALERALASRLRFDEPALRRELGIGRFLLGLRGAPLALRYYFEPTFNLCGLTGGYQGPGTKTVLPREARAKFDVRLVPDMTPGDVARRLRRHLDRHGFRDVAIEGLHGYPPARTPPDHPYVRLVADAGREAFDQPVRIQPTMAASGPMYLFRRLMPCVGFGTGFAGSNIHAPDESIYVEDLYRGIRHAMGVMARLGRA